MITPTTDIANADFKEGTMFLVDKPLGWTSFDVVNKLRFRVKHRLGVKKIKVGHAGTLDPLATGMLIICTGKFTKKLESFQGMPKTYTGTMTLGATTPSFDAETEIDQHYPTEHIDAALIETTRASFMGDQQQYPPMFSAIKVDGEPLYKKARKGEMIEVKARPVHIYELSLPRVEMPEIDFEVLCTKGTYIRSLAYDFGKKMNSGAYLTKLIRTKIGDYSIEDAWNLEDLITAMEDGFPIPKRD